MIHYSLSVIWSLPVSPLSVSVTHPMAFLFSQSFYSQLPLQSATGTF